MKKLTFYFSLLFTLFGNLAIAQDTIVINDEKKQTNIYQSVYYLNDKDSILSIKDILKEEQQSKFVKNVSNPLNTDMGFKSVWIKFSLQNNTGKELFLNIENIDIPEIEIYTPTSKSDSFAVKKMGIIYPNGNKEVFSRFFIIPVSDGKDTNVHTFYIRINQIIHHEIPLNISAAQYLLADSIATDVFFGLLFGMMFIMFFYNLYIYAVIKEIGYLYYSIHIFSSFIFVLVASGYGLLFFWSAYPQANNYISAFAVVTTILVIVPFAASLLETKKYTPLLHKGFTVFFVLLIIGFLTAFFNVSIGFVLIQMTLFLLFIYIFIVGIVVYKNGNKVVRFYIVGNLVYLIGMITLFLKGGKALPVNWFTMHVNYLGTALEILFISFALADKIRYLNIARINAQKENLQLVEEQKETLEEKVQERTSELQSANAEILTQNEELNQQQEELIAINDNLENKNKLIESQKDELERINSKLINSEGILRKAYDKIKESERQIKEQNAKMLTQNEELFQQQEELSVTNETLETTFKHLQNTSNRLNKSIQYANKIQQVILPKKDKIDGFFKEHFVLYSPKDIVSGDFYWFTMLNDNMAIFVLADCTGHGVPGAFMSMIGNTLLHEITKTKGISSPADILLELHNGIRNVLKQEENQNTDGMDTSVCLFEKEVNQTGYKATFAGAKSGIFYTQDKQIVQLDGNRISIGGFTERKRIFTNQTFRLNENDIIYFTSDGYIDQNDIARKRFGSSKFKELLSSICQLPIPMQEQAIVDSLKEHQQEEEQRDDISVVGIRL